MTLDRRLVAEGLEFAEGPRWYGDRLWVADMIGHAVLTVALDGAITVIARFEEEPSGLGFLPDGTPLVVLRRSKLVVALSDGGWVVHADLSAVPCDTLNDMVVDDNGRAYVDAVRMRRPSVEDVGEAVVVVSPDGEIQQTVGGLVNPNGMALLNEGRTLVVAETFAHRLTAFDVQADGSLGRRRSFADLGDATPDGICGDADGAIWLSSLATSEFLRVLDGGVVTDSISVSPSWAVACAFGGPELKQLFLLYADTSFRTLRQPGGTKSFIDVVQPARPGI